MIIPREVLDAFSSHLDGEPFNESGWQVREHDSEPFLSTSDEPWGKGRNVETLKWHSLRRANRD